MGVAEVIFGRVADGELVIVDGGMGTQLQAEGTAMDDVGRLDFPSRALERYTGAFIQALHAEALKEANFRVVIDYAFGNASIVLPQILGALGVEQIAINAYFDAAKVRTFREDRERHLQQLTSVVTSLEANLGVLLDADGETLILVDDADSSRQLRRR